MSCLPCEAAKNARLQLKNQIHTTMTEMVNVKHVAQNGFTRTKTVSKVFFEKKLKNLGWQIVEPEPTPAETAETAETETPTETPTETAETAETETEEEKPKKKGK